jgi:hypothetical protein
MISISLLNTADRFEVDGANITREFLRQQKILQQDIDTVQTSIALYTTPGIPKYMHPVVALLTDGVEMEFLHVLCCQCDDCPIFHFVNFH